MKILVLPHADFSLHYTAPDDQPVMALHQAFIQRLLQEQAQRELDFVLAQHPSASNAQRLLALRVAGAVLARKTLTATKLRALAPLLFAFTQDRTVRVQPDDIVLLRGTTQSFEDLATCISPLAALPFFPELEEAARSIQGESGAVLWLERDLQLPAAWALREMSATPLWVAGPLARSFPECLPGAKRLPDLTLRRGCQAPWLLESREDLTWRAANEPLPEREAWAGEITLQECLHPASEVSVQHCRALVLGLCSMSETVVGRDGTQVERSRFEAAVKAWGGSGARVWIEWYVGAPGITQEEHEQTYAALFESPLASAAQVFGLGRFTWQASHEANSFAGRPVMLSAPNPHQALARTRPFTAEGTLAEEEVAFWLNTSPTARLPRLAASYLAHPETPAPHQGLRLAEDAAIIEMPYSLEGVVGATHYGVKLGVSTFKLDPRLAQAALSLSVASDDLSSGTAGGEGFAQLPQTWRDKALAVLRSRHFLAEPPQ